jgi:ASC-1-like (ASCH) protein
MTVHRLKIAPEYFEADESGAKTFEIRFNDRDFKSGDTVVLCEYIADLGVFTERTLTRTIGYVTDYAQQPGYVVFSLLAI